MYRCGLGGSEYSEGWGQGPRSFDSRLSGDRVVQGALKLILEPIFEADFQPGSFGYRPKRTAHEAVDRLKAGGKQGVPQGGVISPLLSNIYLTEVDRMLERAKEASRDGKYTYVEYARFADDLVILIDAYKRHDWLMAAVEKRLREELAELQVEINEEKSWIVDLSRGESFGFLGFDFRQVRSLRGAGRAHYTPKLKKRTALLRKLKDMFGRNQSQPVGRVVKLINPVLRGWVNYFAVGHSSECFSFVKDWVEKKIKRHMQRAGNRQGFGWTRWSREWTYNTLGLFKGYRVVRPALKAVPGR